MHATCEDYRAGASIDLEHDGADRHKKLGCAVLALWAGRGRIGPQHDVLTIWRERATDVRGRALDCGHFLAEELPDETALELLSFFKAGTVTPRV